MHRMLLFLCLSIFIPQSLSAQQWYAPNRVGALNNAYRYGYVPGFRPGFYGNPGNYASTAAESRMRGYADVVRAQGKYNLAASEAMKNREDARSKYMENQEQWRKTYLERKKLAEADIADKRDAKKASRDRWLEKKHSTEAQSRPEGLGPSQLDPNTGRINWPDILKDSKFQGNRERLNELFALKARTQVTTAISQEVRQVSEDMIEQVRGMIADMSANDYVAACKFLRALPYSL